MYQHMLMLLLPGSGYTGRAGLYGGTVEMVYSPGRKYTVRIIPACFTINS